MGENYNAIKDKSLKFAVRIVHLYKYLCDNKKEFVMSKQLLRSGTAIGALYREAEHSESDADFIHKMAIAQKECNETLYWLELLKATDYISEKEYTNINNDAIQFIMLITSIIKTKKIELTINHSQFTIKYSIAYSSDSRPPLRIPLLEPLIKVRIRSLSGETGKSASIFARA